jgi:thiol-disulfide isomerase/thioredoxin
MNRFAIWIVLVGILGSCSSTSVEERRLKTGVWRATVEIQGQELPFNFEVTRDAEGGYDVYLLNASERLLLDEVSVRGDSVDMVLHIFDANIKAAIQGDTLLTGLFIKNYADDYRIPFQARHGVQYRFFDPQDNTSGANFSGKYEATFRHEDETTNAIALFRQRDGVLTGTFMTPTGDYRFLEGNITDSTLYLSTFDGNYSYLFKGSLQQDGTIKGEFFSGKTWYETWVARRNERAELPDATSLTYLKEGYEKISFAFPDISGKSVSLDDPKYKGKVVILQILGTWCPNCMDETKFLVPWYDANKDRGVEIIGLAYERKPDFDYASARVKKMVEKMNVTYDILIAGTSDKESAAKTLPMLNSIVAFPTTIFIGKDGKVKKIHTGFSGPGTRQYYEQFKEEFNETVNSLLQEVVPPQEDFTAKR